MQTTLPSFDMLLEMAKKDPDGLERLRQQHIEAAIKTAPDHYQPRLAGLQFQIDGARRTSKSPMAACLHISKMMHDSLHQLKSFIDEDEAPAQLAPLAEAKVLAFPG